MTEEKQFAIIEELSAFEDWMDRYTYLIACAAELPPMPEEHKTKETLFPGCASKVWLFLSRRDGRIFLECDSDSLIVKGLLSLYYRIFNGETAESVAGTRLFFEKETGLAEHLPPDRLNGMAAFANEVRRFAGATELF